MSRPASRPAAPPRCRRAGCRAIRIAAALYTSGRLIAGLSALVWHGVADLPDDGLIHMLLPHHGIRRASTGFVRVQRTRRPDPGAKPAGDFYTVCTPARACVDAARHIPDRTTVDNIVTELIGHGWTTLDELRKEAELAWVIRTKAVRLALQKHEGGVSRSPDRL